MATQNIPANVQSLLAVDFGSVNTRLVLIDLVNGQYRLVSRVQTPTTLDAPLKDVTIGLSRAVEIMQENTGRTLVDLDGILIFPEQQDGSGVDEVIATTSAAPPLRAALVGLVDDLSIQSAVRALSGTYIKLIETVSITDEKSEQEQINTLLQAQPDLIFLTGGTDGGNTETVRQLIDMVDTALLLFPQGRVPIVLYAGNADLAQVAYEQLKADSFGRDVFVAPNIRPQIEEENLNRARLELSLVYSNFVSSQPGGFFDVSTVSKVGIIPTAQSISNILRWMGELPLESVGILHVDVGSATSSLSVAINKEVSANVQTELGVGHSLPTTLDQLDLDAVRRWLPFPITKTELYDYGHNKALIPSTIPQNTRDLMIEYAIIREVIRYLVRSEEETWKRVAKGDRFIPDFQPIILAGSTLTKTGQPSIAAMLAIDALELEGIVHLYTDPFGVLPALGAIALMQPIVTVQVFENQALTHLGPMLCAAGRPRRRGSKPAMRIKITLRSGRILEKDLMPGEMWAAPISPGQEASVEVRMGRGLNLDGKRRIKQIIKAGLAGIVFDARGRPLQGLEPSSRASTLRRWWSGVSEYTPPEMTKWAEDEWIKPVDEDFSDAVAAMVEELEARRVAAEDIDDEELAAERRRRELDERISS